MAEEDTDKKKAPENPKSLFSLKGSQLASKLGDWVIQHQKYELGGSIS